MKPTWQKTYWLNLVTGEVLGQIPRHLDIYQQAAWFVPCDKEGNQHE